MSDHYVVEYLQSSAREEGGRNYTIGSRIFHSLGEAVRELAEGLHTRHYEAGGVYLDKAWVAGQEEALAEELAKLKSEQGGMR